MNTATKLPFLTHLDGVHTLPVDTFLVGSIQATRAQMTKAFGKPLVRGGSRASNEWHLAFEDGTVATVYDFRRCAEGQGDDTPIAWTVGGQRAMVLTRVHMAFRQQMSLSAFSPSLSY